MSVIAFDSQRLAIAAIALAVYALMCLAILRTHLAKRSAARSLNANASGAHWRIVYASQTGSAEELAHQTANTLRVAGLAVQLNTLAELKANDLAQAERILFIVSTYGEGNPPDNAAAFAQHVMNSARLNLNHLHYAMLALGDSSYAHFCGFGRELDRWLQTQGAQVLFPIIDVDRGDAGPIENWRHQLSHLIGTDDAPDWQGPAYDHWRLAERRLLNPGSQGHGAFHLEFEPAEGTTLPAWESGDLVQILVPTDSARPREYSIASIPNDGRVHLLVRLHHHSENSFGAASSWLAQQIAIGDSVPLRLRRHERFRLGDNVTRPLILIGNGSGIAGLRGHLKARASMEIRRNWLIFGERSASCDYYYRDEIEAWYRAGTLEKLDIVFSRDQPERRYVQHCLIEAADAVRDWVEQGAAIYICGSLKGMAAAVDDALASALGRQALEKLTLTNRYRRDVY